jgi:hypothetical protein
MLCGYQIFGTLRGLLFLRLIGEHDNFQTFIFCLLFDVEN